MICSVPLRQGATRNDTVPHGLVSHLLTQGGKANLQLAALSFWMGRGNPALVLTDSNFDNFTSRPTVCWARAPKMAIIETRDPFRLLPALSVLWL